MILNGWNVIYRVSFESDNPNAHDDFNTKEEAIAWAEEHINEKPTVKCIELFVDDDGNIDSTEGESEIVFSYKDNEEVEEPSVEDRLIDLEKRLNSIEQFLEEPKSEEEIAALESEEKLSSEEVGSNEDVSDEGIPEESEEVSVEVEEPVDEVEEDSVEEIPAEPASEEKVEDAEEAAEDEAHIAASKDEVDFEPYAFMGEKPAPEDVYVDPFDVDFDDVIDESLIIKTDIGDYRP